MNTSHNKCIDIAKGIGILFMVMGHAGFPYSKFFYFFHMPLFFILAGYVFKDKYISDWKNLKTYFIKRIKSLYLPFVICNIFFLIFNNLFVYSNIYTTNQALLDGNIGNNYGIDKILSLKNIIIKLIYIIILATGTKLGGATWFLKVLFFISIFFALIAYFLKKYIYNEKVFYVLGFIITIILLLAGFTLHKFDFTFYHIGIMLSSSILFYIGYIFKEFGIIGKITFKIFGVSFIILLISSFIFDKGINLSTNNYYNPFLLIVFSLSGFAFTIYVSKYLNNIKFLSNIFEFLGLRTMPILCLHLLFFKIVTYIQVILYSLPTYRLASFPYYYTKYWWILYTIVGILGPIIVNYLYLKIKHSFFMKYSC